MATAARQQAIKNGREGGKEGDREDPESTLDQRCAFPGFWNLTSRLRAPLCKRKNCSAAWKSSAGEARDPEPDLSGCRIPLEWPC